MRGTAKRFADFRGGANTRDSAYLLEPAQARDLRNVVSSVRGAVRKRDGSQVLAVPAAAFTSLAPLEATATKLLIGAGGTALYSITTGGVISSRKTGLTSGLRWEFVEAPVSGGQGPLYGMNGADTPQQWDEAAAGTSDWTASAGAVPNGKYVIAAGNRVLVAGVPGFPNRLYACGVGDPCDWGTNGWTVDFEPSDGDLITGVGTAGPFVLVFKRKKVFVVTDLNSGANYRLARGTGCAAHRSIADTPIGAIFLTPDKGVWITDGHNLQRLSDPIAPTVAGMNPAQAAKAAGIYLNDHYYLSIPTAAATENDLTLDYDLQLRSWWFHTLAEAQWAAWQPSSALELYGARAGALAVDKAFVPGIYQDGGANFDSYWKGAWLVFGDPHVKKRCRQIRFDGKGVLDVSIAKDFSVGEALARSVNLTPSNPGTFGGAELFGGTQPFGGDSAIKADRIKTPGVARAWSLRFGANNDQPWEVDSYEMAMTARTD